MWVTHLNSRFLISAGCSAPLNLVFQVTKQSLQKRAPWRSPLGQLGEVLGCLKNHTEICGCPAEWSGAAAYTRMCLASSMSIHPPAWTRELLFGTSLPWDSLWGSIHRRLPWAFRKLWSEVKLIYLRLVVLEQAVCILLWDLDFSSLKCPLRSVKGSLT